MKQICIIIKIHHSARLHSLSHLSFQQGERFYDKKEEAYYQNIYLELYEPLLKYVLKNSRTGPEFCFSISGTAIDLFEKYSPFIIYDLKEIFASYKAEVSGGTYSDSLSCLKDTEGFSYDVRASLEKIREVFHVSPSFFYNTAMINTLECERAIAGLGFKGLFVRSGDKAIQDKKKYKVHGRSGLKLIPVFEITADNINSVSAFMDSSPEDGLMVFSFNIPSFIGEGFIQVKKAIEEIILYAENKSCEIVKLSEIKTDHITAISRTLQFENTPIKSFLGNVLQFDAFDSLYRLQEDVIRTGDKYLIRDFLELQSSGHLLLMNDKAGKNSRLGSSYEYFVNFMEALRAVRRRLETNISNKNISLSQVKFEKGEKDILRLEEFRNN